MCKDPNDSVALSSRIFQPCQELSSVRRSALPVAHDGRNDVTAGVRERRGGPAVLLVEILSNFCQIFVKFQQNLHKFLHPR